MSDLANKKCKECSGAMQPLGQNEMESFKGQLDSAWQIVDNHHLLRKFKFKNFKEALAFTNKVGDLAESEGHHPDILLKWGEVEITIYTHKVNGLTESDFVLAAKIDKLPAR
jgi:4a-hydroxytetrahydrobiopterin dehydratase